MPENDLLADSEVPRTRALPVRAERVRVSGFKSQCPLVAHKVDDPLGTKPFCAKQCYVPVAHRHALDYILKHYEAAAQVRVGGLN